MTASIAQLKIKLDDVEPAVVRRVEVPLTIRLDRLHLVLQAAMGWTNSHLYELWRDASALRQRGPWQIIKCRNDI